MLSQDLTSLARMAFLSLESDSAEDLKRSLMLVAERVQEGADQAAHLEAAAVAVRPTMIDLSDEKIALFPVAKRPVPSRKPEGAA
ncbi:hypothetical protein [Labrenzia sp. CE80]|uniref:hypothetical protein n=1 Tax=Labrenzia sp. CE80 TaxID=1788986 RepID=UPI00129B5277|nr:hypothetical protein [Labrenzia sp. CE80]